MLADVHPTTATSAVGGPAQEEAAVQPAPEPPRLQGEKTASAADDDKRARERELELEESLRGAQEVRGHPPPPAPFYFSTIRREGAKSGLELSRVCAKNDIVSALENSPPTPTKKKLTTSPT